MKISAEIINEIADNLEIGFTCYFNKDTSQLIVIPGEVDIYLDEDDDELYELEPWYEDAKIIKASPDSFIQVDEMHSNESFRIMEDFIETVGDENLRRIHAIMANAGFQKIGQFAPQVVDRALKEEVGNRI